MDAFLNNVGGIVDASVICMYDLPRYMVMTSLRLIAYTTVFAVIPAGIFAYYMDRWYVRRRNLQN